MKGVIKLDNRKPIYLYNLLNSLSLAMDFSRIGLMNHHQRVALLSLKIARAINIPDEKLQRLFCAAIIHDAGTSTWKEKAELEVFEIGKPWDHCERGFKLINSMNILSPVAHIILCHHDRWEGNNPSELAGRDIPVESRIIHIADRIDILAGKTNNILNDRYDIINRIKGYANIFLIPILYKLLRNWPIKKVFGLT